MKRTLVTLIVVALLGLPIAAQTSKKMSKKAVGDPTEELKKIENDWAVAAKNKDKAAVEKIEADNYVFVMPDGKIRNRADDVASVDKSNYTTIETTDLDVRKLSDDTAEVIGVLHLKGTESGKDMSGDYRFTDVFVNENGQWKAVSTHASKIEPGK